MTLEQVCITTGREGDQIHHHSPVESKIALFRSLFRGREDVYPRRFESRKTGKSGYQPVCANEWTRGLCEKLRAKCADCPNRRLLAVTNEVVRWHLCGKDDNGRAFVMGVYPMLPDETCFGGFRQGQLARRRGGVHENMPRPERAGCLGAVAIG